MNAITKNCQNPKNPKLPTTKDVAAHLRQTKPEICDDYRASEDDTLPSLQVTLACDGDDCDRWTIQTGDNSYTGCAYGYQYWGVSTLYRRSNCRALARELIEQIAEQWWSGQ